MIAEVATVCEKIKRKRISCGKLAQFEFLDSYHYWTFPQTPGISKLVDVTLDFGRAANAWADACHTLKQLSENSLAEARDITATYFTVM